MKQILIYGAINDVHLTRVANLLVKQGLQVYFVDPVAMSNTAVKISNKCGISDEFYAISFVTNKPELIDLNNIVFWRRNKRRIPTFYNEQEQHLHYTFAEIDNFLDGLINFYQTIELSATTARFEHEHKLFQLGIAAKVGLLVPPTIISNNKIEILNFVTQYNECIVKPLKHPVWSPPVNQPDKGATFLVNIVNAQEVKAADEDSFSHYPLIFQRNIPKNYELRIVCVGEQCVAFKIDSQVNQKAKIDWRRATKELSISQVVIPNELEGLLVKYLNVTGLGYGVFDFIFDLEGNYIFLECNSDGQWAFLEEVDNKCPVAPLFAQQLIELAKH